MSSINNTTINDFLAGFQTGFPDTPSSGVPVIHPKLTLFVESIVDIPSKYLNASVRMSYKNPVLIYKSVNKNSKMFMKT